MRELEDSIVLSKEEYDNLRLGIQKAHNKGVQAGFDMSKFKEESIKRKERKETTEKILKELLFVESVEGWQENEQLVEFGNKIVDKIEELAKQCGVEIKEWGMESEKVKEIKNGLGNCQKDNCLDCPYFAPEKMCRASDLLLDTIILINELESKNEALQKGVKRLKKRYEETITKNADECVKKFCETTMYHEQEKFVNENQQLKDRLAELEDKIENGTLIELPCRVGDIVYCVFSNNQNKWVMRKYQVTKIWFDFNGLSMNLYCYGIVDKDDIGKTVFFTEAEAKVKLKEQQNER